MKLTAVILTKNEEKNIERCLKSVDFCDEVIIVDDYSIDKTVEQVHKVLKVHKVYKVLQRRLKGDFAAQRNFGMEKAKGEWVLFLDADEEVSDELKKEIISLARFYGDPSTQGNIESQDEMPNHTYVTNYSAFRLKRRDFWWGRELKWGETRKVRQRGLIRLVKKNAGKWMGRVHEEFRIKNSEFGILKNFLNHYPHPTVKKFLEEINFYSTLRAKELFDQGKYTNILEIILYPLGKFVVTYFIKVGFLDGAAGFTYAFMMSFHSFLVRAKLYQYKKINSNLKSHPSTSSGLRL